MQRRVCETPTSLNMVADKSRFYLIEYTDKLQVGV